MSDSCNPMNCSPPDSSVHGDSPGQNSGAGCRALLQGIFPIQRSNPDLPYYGGILHRLSQQGSPTILEWVAYPLGLNQKTGQRTKQTLLQGRHTGGQQTHEKMLNITHYQRNANQNHNEVPSHASQDGCYPKVYKQ